MAFTEFYCNAATGSNLNAGSTESGTAAQTYASGSWVQSTGVFTVASGDPVADGVAVGDFVSVYADGSTVTGFVSRVTARTTTTITASLTAKSGTAPTDGTNTRTLKVGGAWKGPNAAETFPFAFMAPAMTNASGHAPRANFKNNATYNITAAIAHTPIGPDRWEGYETTPGDGGKATIDGGTSGATYGMLSINSSDHDVLNFVLTHNGATGNATVALDVGTRGYIKGIVVHDVRGIGISCADAHCIECEVYNCNQGAQAGQGAILTTGGSAIFTRCIAHDNAAIGFRMAGGSARMIDCVSDSNTSYGLAYESGTGHVMVDNCDFYNNGGDGIRFSATPTMMSIENCNLVKNGGYGVNALGTGTKRGAVVNCGFGAGTQANTSGQTNGLQQMVESGSVTYPANVTPWVDPAAGDFRINLPQAKGAGRGAFTQTASGYAGAVGYPDIGSAQSRAASNNTSMVLM